MSMIRRLAAVAVAAFLLGAVTGPMLAGTALAPITLQPGQTITITAAGLPTPVVTPTPTAVPTPTPTAVQTPTPTATPTPALGWVTVVNDQFDAGLPAHWASYNGAYGSGPHNCAIPAHATVNGGILHMLMSYQASGTCGAGWYTAGLALIGFSSIDQRVTVRFRVVDSNVSGHFIIPMRWPDNDASWPAGGEEDYCETDAPTGCTSFLHYGSSNSQTSHAYSVDLSQWHVLRFQRLKHVVTASIDGVLVWTFNGSATTLPDTLKHVVLQQECHSSCPSGTTGTEDIQIDWITVENPS